MSADTSDRPLTVHYRAKLLPWSLVLAPYGEQFLRLRKLYHRLLGFQGSLVFQVHSENESLFMMKALADDPDIAHSECDRYGFNLMMRAIYGVHYGSDDGNMVHETFSLWEKMFCCESNYLGKAESALGRVVLVCERLIRAVPCRFPAGIPHYRLLSVSS